MKRRIAALLIAGVITASGCQGGFALAAETETENQAETGTEESTEDIEEAENSLSEEERAESLAGSGRCGSAEARTDPGKLREQF